MGGYGRSGEWHHGAINPWAIPGAVKGKLLTLITGLTLILNALQGRFPYPGTEERVPNPRSPPPAGQLSPLTDDDKIRVRQIFLHFDTKRSGILAQQVTQTPLYPLGNVPDT